VAVSPSRGPASGGTPITITGDDFAPGAIVLFDGLPALNVVVLTSTTIAAVTPAHGEGALDVVVTNPNGESVILAGGYTYTTESAVAPMIEAVSPPSGPATGGTEIVISGRGFAEGATVNLGAWPAMNVVLLSEITVTATTSPHGEGTFDVTVINPDGHFGTFPGAYTYVADAPPDDLVVTITPAGVTPKELRVPVGSRVTFVNSDSRAHDIESDPHPIHTDCSAVSGVGFIRLGESKQTGVFEVERTCGYHDHNQSTNRALQGTIVVISASVADAAR
jgi:plastocyanin